MKNLFKRSLAVALALVMCVSMLNLTAFADSYHPGQNASPCNCSNARPDLGGSWYWNPGYVQCMNCKGYMPCPGHKDGESSTNGEKVNHDHSCDYCHAFLGDGYREVPGEAIPATCTSVGVKVFQCSWPNCPQGRRTETTPALGHNYGEWTEDTPATCTTEGAKHRSCLRDGCFHVENGIISALGHAYPDTWTKVTAATCTTRGEEKRVCTNDPTHVETRAISALGHDMVTDAAVDPNCVTSGTLAGEHCSRCDYTTGGGTVEALGHDWGNWIPTSGNEGETHTRTCQREGCNGTGTNPGTQTASHNFSAWDWEYTDWVDDTDDVRIQHRTATGTRTCNDCGYEEEVTVRHTDTDKKGLTDNDLTRKKGEKTFTVAYLVRNGGTSTDPLDLTTIHLLEDSAPANVEIKPFDGYTFYSKDCDVITFEDFDDDTVVHVYYTRNSYNLTIKYVDAQDNTLAPTHTESLPFEDTYSVDSPAIPGYQLADSAQSTVSGTMPAGDVTVKVEYSAINYTLVVNYVDAQDGNTLDSADLGTKNIGDGYSVEDRSFTGYYQVENQTLNGTVNDALIATADENNRIVINVYYAELDTNIVRWVNWNGTVLETGSFYENEEAPEASAYSNAAPTRPSDGTYNYSFSGWSEPAVDADGNVTYTAQFSATSIPTPAPSQPVEIEEPETPLGPLPEEPEEPVEVEEPETPLGPLPELPEDPEVPVEVEEPETPLGPLPELPEQPAEIEVEDPDVPLAAVPQTGDNTMLWVTTAVASEIGRAHV